MIRLSSTLSSYLARHFLIGFGVVILVLLTLGFLVDLVELLRRGSDKEGASFPIEIVRGGKSLTIQVSIPKPDEDPPTGPRARYRRGDLHSMSRAGFLADTQEIQS